MFRLLLLGFLLFGTLQVMLPIPSYAISLDDEEEDAEDVADLLVQAKKEGANESFDKADELLKKAKMYGVESEDTQETGNYVAQKKKERDERLEAERQAKLEAERQERERLAALERQQQQASSYGLAQDQCYRASGSYALYKYCTTGSCDGFVSNYALYQLCKYDDPNGFNSSYRNTNINLYLRNGGYLSYDYFDNQAAFQSGKFNGSFQERKNFILYLLSGMTLIRY
jgi:hypothetical protein